MYGASARGQVVGTVADVLSWKDNLETIGSQRRALIDSLIRNGQEHLFANWAAPGVDDDKKLDMMTQLEKLEESYPGGLVEYIQRSKQLLDTAQSGGNALAGFTPSVPTGERLTVGSKKFTQSEALGMTEVAHAAFVLVAGGLGERLGFSGIKVSLPSELVTGKPFLQLYADNILALQDRAREASGDNELRLPLAIMTSGDTHQRTLDLLNSNHYFGLHPSQVSLIKQQKVPALSDADAHIAVDPENPYKIQTKPHGHGDVHTLLHTSGIVDKWLKEGRRWIMFFQDTNGLIFQAVPALIGVSRDLNLEVNTLTVPRRPGEPVGSICHLRNAETRHQLTLNVEYNQLEGLLKSTVSPEGDVASPETGFSPYPGNTNALVFRVEPYAKILQNTGGRMPEFVNPKFKDESKTAFKKPTRLECMMQDYPRLLERDARVGFTQLERWVCFAAVKNNAADAAKQFEKTGFAESASTAESSIYAMHSKKLELIGVDIQVGGSRLYYNGVPTNTGPKVVLSPSFATTFEETKRKFRNPEKVSITSGSSLNLEGRDIEIKSLDLDGALTIKAVPGAHVLVDGLKVKNNGDRLNEIDANDETLSEALRIRGYDIAHGDREVHVFDKPGRYVLKSD